MRQIFFDYVAYAAGKKRKVITTNCGAFQIAGIGRQVVRGFRLARQFELLPAIAEIVPPTAVTVPELRHIFELHLIHRCLFRSVPRWDCAAAPLPSPSVFPPTRRARVCPTWACGAACFF